MTEHKKVVSSFKQFYIDLKDYFGALPTDLKMTLEDIRDFIERNKKNG